MCIIELVCSRTRKMQRSPLQNRVDPQGKLNAHLSKSSTLMGNRGILHNDEQEVVKQWVGSAWVTCLIHVSGLNRNTDKKGLFRPSNYSELFFLDEATAFSAGHRPCAYCRRARYSEFKSAWLQANSSALSAKQSHSIKDIDRHLHAERAIRGGGKLTFRTAFSKLPSGAFVELDSRPYLLWNGSLRPWAFIGYDPSAPISNAEEEVTVLTPRSTVAAFLVGFKPDVHPSVNA